MRFFPTIIVALVCLFAGCSAETARPNIVLIVADDRYWLYDLSEDIGEQTNLAAERPEIAERLKSAYDRWDSEMIDPLWPPIGVKASPQFSVDGIAIDWPV